MRKHEYVIYYPRDKKMTVLLFGVTCVGKTTVGEVLSKRLNWSFYDLDAEVKIRRKTTIEDFVRTGTLFERDSIRGELINDILMKDENLVLAVSPITYPDSFYSSLKGDDIILIELRDTAYHIFQRIIFSDEEDRIYTDEKYKMAHKTQYIKEIQKDLKYYGTIYQNLGASRFDINNDSPEKVAQRIVEEYHLEETLS